MKKISRKGYAQDFSLDKNMCEKQFQNPVRARHLNVYLRFVEKH